MSYLLLTSTPKGALIIGDAIAGAGGPGEAQVVGANTTQPLPKAIGDRISALVLYGDPRHMPLQPYNVFNSNVTGVSQRTVAYGT